MCNSSLEPNSEVHRSLWNYGLTIWNLLHITLRWILDFWEICEPPHIIKHYNQYAGSLVQQVMVNRWYFTITTALVGTVSNNEIYIFGKQNFCLADELK
jgi:hypothetical protein